MFSTCSWSNFLFFFINFWFIFIIYYFCIFVSYCSEKNLSSKPLFLWHFINLQHNFCCLLMIFLFFYFLSVRQRIKEGSVVDRVKVISVGDHVECINGRNIVGIRHYEVARMLKELPKDKSFTLKLVEPMKAFGELRSRYRKRKDYIMDKGQQIHLQDSFTRHSSRILCCSVFYHKETG